MADIYTHDSLKPRRFYKIGVGIVDIDGNPIQKEKNMYERFTDRARKVMQLANLQAQRLNHEYISTEHLLLGLLMESSGVATNVLRRLGLDLAKCRAECLKIVQPGLGPGPDVMTMGKLPMTPRIKGCIEQAIQAARDLGHNHVSTEHLLLGLCSESEGIAAQVLKNFGVTMEVIKAEVLNLIGIDTKTDKARENSDLTRSLRCHGNLLRNSTKVWLTQWIGDRHICNSENCSVCEAWEAYDVLFRQQME